MAPSKRFFKTLKKLDELDNKLDIMLSEKEDFRSIEPEFSKLNNLNKKYNDIVSTTSDISTIKRSKRTRRSNITRRTKKFVKPIEIDIDIHEKVLKMNKRTSKRIHKRTSKRMNLNIFNL